MVGYMCFGKQLYTNGDCEVHIVEGRMNDYFFVVALLTNGHFSFTISASHQSSYVLPYSTHIFLDFPHAIANVPC